MEVHSRGAGGAIHNNYVTSKGSYDRDRYQTQTLAIALRDVSHRISRADINVYFVGREMPSGVRVIYDRRNFSVDVGQGLEKRLDDVTSTQVRMHERHKAGTLGEALRGTRTEGWIVIGRDAAGNIFDLKASSTELLSFAKADPSNPDSLAALTGNGGIRGKPKPRLPSPPPEAPAPPPTVAAPPPARTPAIMFSIIKPVAVQVAFGKITLPPGTTLEFVSRDEKNATAIYVGEKVTVPLESTDLR